MGLLYLFTLGRTLWRTMGLWTRLRQTEVWKKANIQLRF